MEDDIFGKHPEGQPAARLKGSQIARLRPAVLPKQKAVKEAETADAVIHGGDGGLEKVEAQIQGKEHHQQEQEQGNDP